MNKKYDFSLHFSTKLQSIEKIDKKFNDWMKSVDYKIIDCSEREEGELRTVLHHCFIPYEIALISKKYDIIKETLDFLDTISEDQVRWFLSDETLGMSRLLMLQNLKRLNGVAIFIGDIIDGVNEEYQLAKELNIEIINIK